jgi:beta-glucanase (GH16 family)
VFLASVAALGAVIVVLLALEGCSPVSSVPSATPRPVASLTSTATPTVTPPPPTPVCDGGEVLWEDAFNGVVNAAGVDNAAGDVNVYGLEVDNWTVETDLCVNDEQQRYVMNTDNLRVENGVLVLEARDTRPGSGECPGCRGDRFTSGRIHSKGKREFQYGRFEARVRMPAGEGYWPAFWLLGADIDQVGWPGCGELDIVENVGYRHWVAGAVHGPGYSAENSVAYTTTLPAGQSSTEWHVYRLDWDADSIQWFIDDKLVHTLYRVTLSSQGQEWVFDHPFFVVLNLALGGHYPFAYNGIDGSAGGCYGLPETTIDALPQRLEVDWVRVCKN